MAQSGFTPIKLYLSTSAAAVPTAANLEPGELALNNNDGKLYYEDSSGVVQIIATKAGSSGDVVGPASATDTAIATFDGVTGKLIKNNASVTIAANVITALGFSGPLNGTVGATTPAAGAFTSVSDSGNLTFTGTGNRILGDFSNATVANRVSFQTSTANSQTAVSILPNGTATTSNLLIYNSSSDPANASVMQMRVDGGGGLNGLAATITGTGTYQPLMFWTGGSERVRIDTSGNVGIGTSSPTQRLSVAGNLNVSGGQLIAGATAVYSDGTIGTPSFQWNAFVGAAAGAVCVVDGTGSVGALYFKNPNGLVGNITVSGSTTSYNTSSDYRLKNTIAPMTGALDKVALLKPCTYKWNADGSDGQGFIAHELQAVVDGCVTGEKDATHEEEYEVSPAVPAVVDAEGVETTPAVQAVKGTRTVPSYQGIDTSFLVATLTAAIQELKAIIDTQATRIAALEGK